MAAARRITVQLLQRKRTLGVRELGVGVRESLVPHRLLCDARFMAEVTGDQVSVSTIWVGVEELSVAYVNQFILQLDQDAGGGGVFLTAGAITPPVILGPPEEQKKQAERLSYVPIRPVVQLGMTRARFEELRGLMNEIAQKWDQQDKERGGLQ